MFSLVLVIIYCASNIIATFLHLKNNYMSTMFDGLAISTFIATILYFISGQMRGVPVAEILFYYNAHIMIVAMLIVELIVKIVTKKREESYG